MNINSKRLPCPLCGYAAEVLNEKHPGYAQPSEFCIAECCYCDVQFCDPMTPSAALYESIYSHAATLPGYSRYRWYADEVSRRSDPLGWLQSQEEMYSFIASELAVRGGPQKFGSVVEIGSGLGYLTFALRKAGYNVRGIELSKKAVEDASRRFGHLYEVCDVTQLHGSVSADAVVMTEVLEHVVDPCSLLTAIRQMLRPGGMALLTTPNKSAAPHSAYWRTDNPPVHLWWFSETTMRRMAERTGLHVSFGHPKARVCRPSWPPYFDADGQQIAPAGHIRKLLEISPAITLRLIALIRIHRQRAERKRLWTGMRSTMCVVLERPE
jgi:SAM-dependent methyltransferase